MQGQGLQPQQPLQQQFTGFPGQLQLNAFEPVICFNILESTQVMTAAMTTLAERCIRGITANREVLDGYVRSSIGVVTALVPVIGYASATEIARSALETGRPVADLVLEAGLLDEVHLNALLSPASMTTPHRATPTGTIPVLPDAATESGEMAHLALEDPADAVDEATDTV